MQVELDKAQTPEEVRAIAARYGLPVYQPGWWEFFDSVVGRDGVGWDVLLGMGGLVPGEGLPEEMKTDEQVIHEAQVLRREALQAEREMTVEASHEDAPARPGMAGPAGRYNPPADVVAFGKEWEGPLNTAVGNRMKAVGVPEEMIGVKGMPYEDPGAFVRSHAIGGSNNNIPGRGIVGSGPGINVDIAVLDARFTQMSKVKSWESASLKDRIDAVIAHEYTEVLATKPTGGLTPHQYAIKNAPETPLKISDRAREILRDYRSIEGLE